LRPCSGRGLGKREVEHGVLVYGNCRHITPKNYRVTRYFIDKIVKCRDILVMKLIAYRRTAIKSLRKMQPKRRAAIIAKIEAYAAGAQVDVKRLVGSAFSRIRVGDDRVIIDDSGNVVDVIDAGPRGGIYKE